MRRNWRPILSTVLVLTFAVFEYLHSSVPTLDIAAPGFAFDSENGKLTDVPSEIRKLDDQVVTVEGYMIPMDQSEEIRQFAVVPVLYSGEFSPSPSVNQVVVANSPVGLSYNPEKIRITGRLHVRLISDEGFLVSLYDMDVQSIRTVYDGPVAKWPWYILGAMPAAGIPLLLRRWVHRRIRRAGYCVRCGYDLRATPSRCPECGSIPT